MILELKNVTKRFGAVTAVDSVSVSISEGETLGVMGPNGSGKTTLLNLIMGVYQLDNGEIRLAGKKINGLQTDAISRQRYWPHLSDSSTVSSDDCFGEPRGR